MQTIMTTFDEYQMPGTSNDIYNPIGNVTAVIRYIRFRYGSPAGTPGIKFLAHGGPYEGYDDGGWLMPGRMPINQTGRPEAVLTPEESAAFIAIAKRFSGGDGGGGMVGRVNFNYFGTQFPTVEQRAMQKRDFALMLSGSS
jgi:SLT domain-containing protein